MLFADLSGFTALAERLDPELVRAFQTALFEAMAQAVVAHDGFVEKYVGDAVMAVFGAPRAHEDDPGRAVEAAAEMLGLVQQLSLAWAARLGRTVTLHAGVHTGPVVAGALGSGAASAYAVTGDTVNTAARLLGAAEPGCLLVSEATERLVRHRFVFGDGRDLALRGKSQTLRVFPLQGRRAVQGLARGLAELGLAAPLVGRATAVAALTTAFDRARLGQAQWLDVVGEAGVGKSRLLDECLSRFEAAGGSTGIALRRTRCTAPGDGPYGTFGALFREAYRVEAADSLAAARVKLMHGLQALGADQDEAEAVASVLHHLLGMAEQRPCALDPEQLKRQITLAARALIELRLALQPLVVVVDDAHWADAASLELLRDLADALAERPLLVIAARRRDTPVTVPRRAARARLELGALDEAETVALLDALLNTDSARQLPPLHGLVHARTGGNPLFVEELVRSLVGRGLLVCEQQQWLCTTACHEVDVPPTLYGLLLARIDKLEAGHRRVLQEAAVLGAEFDGALLRAVTLAPPALDAALRQLAAAELLRAVGAGAQRWRFAHGLLHEVVYQNLLLSRRRVLHKRAGAALEKALGCDAAPGRPPGGQATLRLADLAALGHHWSRTDDACRGAGYLIAAADRARAVYANTDAIGHLERALQTLDEAGDNDPAAPALALEVHERLADLLGPTGRRIDALAHYDTVLQAAESAGDARRVAAVHRRVGGLHWEAGERDRARAAFEAGLARLGVDGDAVERAHLLQEMARLAFRAGDAAGALVLVQRALAVLPVGDGGSRAHEQATVRALACNTLGVALARLGRHSEAVEQIETSVRDAEAYELPQAACRGYTNLGVLYATLDPQRGIETCLRGLAAARRFGDLGFQSHLYANLAVAYCALTDRCEAEGLEAAQAAARLDRQLGLLDHLAVPLIVLAQIQQCRGEQARARCSYEEALALAERIGEPQLLFPCYDGLATLHLDAGQPDVAEAWLARAQAVCARAGVEPDDLMVLPFLC